jgi:hypothetical protein
MEKRKVSEVKNREKENKNRDIIFYVMVSVVEKIMRKINRGK